MEQGTDARLHQATRFHDQVALAEIELYSELLTAVATVEHRLSLAEIDRILGVRPTRSGSDGRPALSRFAAVNKHERPA